MLEESLNFQILAVRQEPVQEPGPRFVYLKVVVSVYERLVVGYLHAARQRSLEGCIVVSLK